MFTCYQSGLEAARAVIHLYLGHDAAAEFRAHYADATPHIDHLSANTLCSILRTSGLPALAGWRRMEDLIPLAVECCRAQQVLLVRIGRGAEPPARRWAIILAVRGGGPDLGIFSHTTSPEPRPPTFETTYTGHYVWVDRALPPGAAIPQPVVKEAPHRLN